MSDLHAIAGKILAALKYCYLPIPTEVNEEEWRGDAEAGGARDYVVSLFHDEMKRAYMHGYAAGAIAAIVDIKTAPSDDLEFNEADNKIGAERSFQKWLKD